ncbi:DUF47 family protein [Caldibacillus lycopersici]|uniref:DUF47 family protein n=1 Tax=Perspicuibacillus lycopersici TaxID=1325689 RepID=A0AAE3IY54_9BACI|nr:DUF47 family protein [Perspicuibacillus lycopersici]MCU9615089.1 DUF47 family protein [Perspicuibacillus lycopersici]
MAFGKKKDKFSVLLCDISENIKEAATFFYDFQIKTASDIKIFSDKVKEHEAKGDTLVHTVIKELNHAFITPIEREDILLLTLTLDDVIDGLEETTALFDMYSIIHPTEHMKSFVSHIKNCAFEIHTCIELLSERKLADIHLHAIKIKEYESNCDHLLRIAIKELFATEKDPIKIIQFKEVYESLEEIADYCQSVATALETVVMKNA